MWVGILKSWPHIGTSRRSAKTAVLVFSSIQRAGWFLKFFSAQRGHYTLGHSNAEKQEVGIKSVFPIPPNNSNSTKVTGRDGATPSWTDFCGQ